jgi:hypothetical protein
MRTVLFSPLLPDAGVLSSVYSVALFVVASLPIGFSLPVQLEGCFFLLYLEFARFTL